MNEPPIPAEVDLRDFRFMPLDVRQLLTSETWIEASSDPRLGHALMSLWAECWHQVPCGSLPDNDQILYRLSMCPEMEEWKRIKERALRGFVKCSDGRLYHMVVVRKALEAWAEKLAYRERRDRRRKAAETANAVRWRCDLHPIGIGIGCESDDDRITTADDLQSDSNVSRSAIGQQPESDSHPIAIPKGTGTGTGNKNPFRKKSPRRMGTAKLSQPDPRHALVVECLQRHYGQSNRGVKMPWSGLGAKRLANLLASNPSRSAEDFILCVEHRFASQANHSESPNNWIGHLLDYFAGPLDRYNKPKLIVGSGTHRTPAGSVVSEVPEVMIGEPLPDDVLKTVREMTGVKTAETWFRPLRVIHDGTHTTLIAPNELFVKWISNHYTNVVNVVFGPDIEIRS